LGNIEKGAFYHGIFKAVLQAFVKTSMAGNVEANNTVSIGNHPRGDLKIF